MSNTSRKAGKWFLYLALPAIIGLSAFAIKKYYEIRDMKGVLSLPFRTEYYLDNGEKSFAYTKAENMGPFKHVNPDWWIEAKTLLYSNYDHGILDVGDVRIAVPKWTNKIRREGEVIIDTSESRIRGSFSSGGGIGRRKLTQTFDGTKTIVEYANFKFRIEDAFMYIDGQTISIGEGKKVVFVSDIGRVNSIVDLETRVQGK